MATYPLSLPTVRLKISGIDRTARGELLAGTLTIRNTLGNQIDTCSFSLKAPESWRGTSSPGRPVVGQDVTVEVQDGNSGYELRFGGTVSSVLDARVGFKTVRWDVECVDYTSLLNRILVTKVYNDTNISDIVRDVVRNFAPEVIVNGNVQDCSTVIDSISYSFSYPSDIIQSLADIAGYSWFVDSTKVLHFYDSTTPSRLSTLSVTNSSNNYFDLAITPRIDQVRNRVMVVGGSAVSATTIETWDATGVENGRFQLKHQNVFATLSGSLPFMKVNGVEQPTILNSVDGGLFPASYTLDSVNGVVYPTDAATYQPTAGDHIEFRYRFAIPITVMRESVESQATVAALEGRDYSTVIAADNPIFYWRLNETTGGTAVNSGTAGVTYSGMYSSGIVRGVAGAIQADTDFGAQFFSGTRILCNSGVQVPRAAGTLEAWVLTGLEPIGLLSSGTTAYREVGIVGSYDTLSYGGAFLWLSSGGTYALGYNSGGGTLTTNEHLIAFTTSGKPSGGGRYDHVVGTWDNSAGWRRLWVNNQLVAQDNLFDPHGWTVPASGIEIGNYDYQRGLTARSLPAGTCIDEVAVYNYMLSGTQVNAHYVAGRYAGVREALVNDPQIKSFDQARHRADAELAKWSEVITSVSFTSFVPGWKIGDVIPIVVTQSGTGHTTFSGGVLAQEVETRFVGNQRAQYVVNAESTRFNWIDYQRQLLRTDRLTGNKQVIQIMRAIEATDAIVIPGSVLVSGATPPYRIAPEWASGSVLTTHPSAVVGYSWVVSGWG